MSSNGGLNSDPLCDRLKTIPELGDEQVGRALSAARDSQSRKNLVLRQQNKELTERLKLIEKHGGAYILSYQDLKTALMPIAAQNNDHTDDRQQSNMSTHPDAISEDLRSIKWVLYVGMGLTVPIMIIVLVLVFSGLWSGQP